MDPRSPEPPHNLFSDDPRDGTDLRPDRLGRSGFAHYLAGLLDLVQAQSESSVLALIGDWGSGKSSVLELLRRELADRTDGRPWLLAEFNPWSYPDPESLQRGFFTELNAALPPDDRASGTKAKLGAFAKAVSPFGKIMTVVGVDAEGVIDRVGELLLGDTSASASKRSAEELLRAVDKPTLMVIDDLDRLTPDELLAVLKLVRLVGRLPNVYYLLSYDERTLLDVLGQTPLASGHEDRARAYLEKIVQVRLDMPMLRAQQRSDLLNDGLNAILEANNLALDTDAEERLSDAYSAALDRRLTTPRAISRFLGQVQAFFPPLRDEVNFVDFFLVSWLRTQEPRVYAMLQREREALLGGYVDFWSFGRDAAAAEKRQAFWQGRLDESEVHREHRDGVVHVLSRLFPHVEAAFSSTSTFNSPGEPRTAKSIADKDYFDRYFTFGVPAEDLPDSAVAEALACLTATRQSDALTRFTEELRQNAPRTVRKVEAYRDRGSEVPEVALFELLAKVQATVVETSRELFANPRRTLEREAATCLMHMSTTAAAQTVQRVASDPDLAGFVVSVIHRLHRDQRSQGSTLVPPDYDLAPLTHQAATILQQHFAARTAQTPFADGAMSGYWKWQELAPSSARDWLLEQVDSGRWSLLDAVSSLTSIATATGARGERTGIGGLDLATVEAVFTLGRVLQELAADINAAAPFRGDPLDVTATEENRKHYTLSELKRLQSQQSASSPDGGEAPPPTDTQSASDSAI